MKVRPLQYIALLGVAAIFLGPLYWLVSTALKQPGSGRKDLYAKLSSVV